MSFKAEPSNRGAFHQLMENGKTPKEIAKIYGVTEFAVVATLKHSSPAIEGACYEDLELPEDQLRKAFEENKLAELSDELAVSVTLLKARLRDIGLVRGRGRPKKNPSASPKKNPSASPKKNPSASPVTTSKEVKEASFYELLLQESAKGGVSPESASKIAQLFKKLI